MNQIYNDRTFENLCFSGDESYSDEFDDCTFINCLFEDSFISESLFMDCQFISCTVKSLTIKDCRMRGCAFIECNLIGINWDDFITGCGDYEAPIERFEKCLARYNSFSNLSLVKIDFKESTIEESSFLRCNCKEADFSGCDLENTQFTECDLTKADFRNAFGWNIGLNVNKIKGAHFSFPEVVNLLNGLGISWD